MTAPAPVRRWLVEPPPEEVVRALDRLARTDDVRAVAVLPDVHLARDVCAGVAVATDRLLYPQAVGNDLGCGMAAVRLAGPAALLADERAAAGVLAGFYRAVPALRHPRPTLLDRLPAPLAELPLSHPALEKLKRRDGRVQFATLGRGNHFLEVQADAGGGLWLMVHSGSRAVGQAIAGHHLARARPARTGLRFLAADSPEGRAYLQDLAWARAYAAASRRAMLDAAAAVFAGLFGVAADPASLVNGDHNHVRRETHGGAAVWVHRKGAASAHEGEAGVLPGSMATASFHVTGRGHPAALGSRAHGAGRRLSRTDARRTVTTAALERQMAGVWYDRRLADRLRDEAPAAYKDVHAVLRAQRDLARIVRELRPVLTYKGA